MTAVALLTLVAATLWPVPAAHAQPSQVQAVLASMTPEERVGQLFLVTLRGTDSGAESQIHDLIANQHMGGVVLLAENNNFVDEPDTIAGAHQLITALQTIEWEATEQTPQPSRSVYVPLFIGISQEGDGAPHDQILSGLTP
jgi:beta-N-acetylhexosaminidase